MSHFVVADRKTEYLLPQPGALDRGQINLTDEESRITPVAGGGFEHAYNAQAGVDAATVLVVAVGFTQAANDKVSLAVKKRR